MDQRLSALNLCSRATVGAWTALMNSLRTLITVEVRAYRPEAYYMRGPGPKWREKHAREQSSALP
jgi:hypothetical protein